MRFVELATPQSPIGDGGVTRHLARSRNEYFEICLSISANFRLDIFKSTLMCRLLSTSQNSRAREVSGLTGLETRISQAPAVSSHTNPHQP
jgi:hypothetical protein